MDCWIFSSVLSFSIFCASTSSILVGHSGVGHDELTSRTISFHDLSSSNASLSALTKASVTSSSTALIYAWTKPAGLNFGKHIGIQPSDDRRVSDEARVFSRR